MTVHLSAVRHALTGHGTPAPDPDDAAACPDEVEAPPPAYLDHITADLFQEWVPHPAGFTRQATGRWQVEIAAAHAAEQAATLALPDGGAVLGPNSSTFTEREVARSWLPCKKGSQT